MDELILLSLKGTATPDEERELERWRAASPANEFRYQEVRTVWELTGMRDEIQPVSRPLAVAEVLSNGAKGAVRSPRPWWLAASAAVLAFLAVYAALGRALSGGEATISEYRTGPNELSTAVLTDGSVARLAPNTTLRVRLDDGTRQAEMQGRAFFVIAHDESRPFRIFTPGGEVHVLGTRFELDTNRDQIRLLVVDGRVALRAAGGSAELVSGELAEARPGQAPTVTSVESPEERLDWMGAWMAFESTPLRNVASEIELRLGIQVEIADSALGERTFTGWFSENDRNQMLAVICRVAELTCTTTPQGVLRMDY